MDEKKILKMCVRLGIITVIVTQLNSVPFTFLLDFSEVTNAPVPRFFMTFGPLIVSAIIASILWMFPNIVLQGIEFEKSIKIDKPETLITGLFVVVGMFVVIYGLSDLVYNLSVFKFYSTYDSGFPVEPPPEERAAFFGTLAELILGVGLLFGSKGFIAVLSKFGKNLG